ncbi:MAG: hypothetical protein F6K18_31720 [Okeania sp. SIO2C2]|uniref:hypothetical protein n=1 Tax=Okeania sp. SIO2C2 TaxID=2607787 RepID=UPI0013BD93B3|nr:hypothetical protein [Okeania sp. SIO2C2]NEP91016.1 hypothetical protein [Okeania sp. SIO2C2]
MRAGVRSQEERVRRNGNYRGCSWKNCPLIFLSLSAQNANFLSFLGRKAGTFFNLRKLKLLYVNALIVNQQALINANQRANN